jgi:hypothetical protein
MNDREIKIAFALLILGLAVQVVGVLWVSSPY